MIIYKATNKINNKCYIGQTRRLLDRRIAEHKRDIDRHPTHFHCGLKKWGFENFKWTILEVCMSIEELNEKEEWYINHFDSFNNGYNKHLGGSGKKGYQGRHGKHTEESIKKMSLIKTGKKASEETKKKISDSLKGKRPQNWEELIISNKGKKRTKETRLKMSLSRKAFLLKNKKIV